MRYPSEYNRIASGSAVTYLPRIVDAELADLLVAAGAVLVEGPRASGKTATAARAAASEVLLDVDDNARRLIGADPAAVLLGGTPRLNGNSNRASGTTSAARSTGAALPASSSSPAPPFLPMM